MGYTVFWDQLPFTDYTYNNVIKTVPTVVKTKFCLMDWGFCVGDNVDDSVAIQRIPTELTFVKTNRLPYTSDVMKVLMLMVEYGAAVELGHDDADMNLWLTALAELHAIKPLASYEMQKQYFLDKMA
jgi:hypothetical protein